MDAGLRKALRVSLRVIIHFPSVVSKVSQFIKHALCVACLARFLCTWRLKTQ